MWKHEGRKPLILCIQGQTQALASPFDYQRLTSHSLGVFLGGGGEG